jgi:hypothetical protein
MSLAEIDRLFVFCNLAIFGALFCRVHNFVLILFSFNVFRAGLFLSSIDIHWTWQYGRKICWRLELLDEHNGLIWNQADNKVFCSYNFSVLTQLIFRQNGQVEALRYRIQ